MRRYIQGFLKDNQGNVMGGVSFYVYMAGTNNQANIYSSLTSTTPLSQPQQTDANGRFGFYISDFDYGSGQLVDIVFDTTPAVSLPNIRGETITTTYTLSANTTCNGDIYFPPGVTIALNSYTLTLNGKVDAGGYLVFTGTGTVNFNGNSVIYKEWCGPNVTVGGTAAKVISGSLEANRVPYCSSAPATLSSSNIYVSGNNVGIGGTPSYPFHAKNTVVVDKDSTSAFQVRTEDGSSTVFNVDTINKRLGVNATTVYSSFENAGSTALKQTTITSSATAGDYTTYFLNASSGEIVLTLPSASTCPGRVYHIVRAQQYPSAHNCIIACQSGQTINGEPSLALDYNYDRVTVQSNGSNWIVIGT